MLKIMFVFSFVFFFFFFPKIQLNRLDISTLRKIPSIQSISQTLKELTILSTKSYCSIDNIPTPNLSVQMIRVLVKLSQDLQNVVFLLSSLPRHKLESICHGAGLENVGLIADGGLSFRFPGATTWVEVIAFKFKALHSF